MTRSTHSGRVRVLTSLIRKEGHDLVALRRQHQQAARKLETTERRLLGIEHTVARLEADLRAAMARDAALALDGLQQARDFLLQQYHQRKHWHRERERVALELGKLAAQLLDKLAYLRGLERVCDSARSQLERDDERARLRELDDLSVTQFLRAQS